MAQRSVEEVFRTIAPSRRRGVPDPPAFATGVSGNNGNLSNSLSQAGAEISQLRASYQQQADLITANTQAVQNNTSAQGTHSAAGTAGSVASSILGGGLGFLSPIVSGLLHLFGGGSSAPPQLPVYTPPPPVSISGVLHSTTPPPPGSSSGNLQSTAAPQSIPAGNSESPASPTGGTTYAPQITVHVNAMDSQSFMDRSADIASAVREAMLNNHPINGVVADL